MKRRPSPVLLVVGALSLIACGAKPTAAVEPRPDAEPEEPATETPRRRATADSTPLPEHEADCKAVVTGLGLLEGEPWVQKAVSEVPETPEERQASVAAIDRALARWPDTKRKIVHREVREAADRMLEALKKRRNQLAGMKIVKTSEGQPATAGSPAVEPTYEVDSTDFVDTRGAFYDAQAPFEDLCEDRRPIG